MKVAVYAICKNEEQHVERWLKTSADADVRVVADTGSDDGSWSSFFDENRLCIYPISIEPFRFDDARNAALALVPSDVDVCVSLDMDEVLSDGWREELERANWLPGTQANITFDYHGRKFMQNTRVHSRHGWRWQHPYHEGLYPNMQYQPHAIDLPGITITHAPVGQKTRPDIALHNLAWGEFEKPGDARMMFYYGRELLWKGYRDEGLRKLLSFVELYPNSIDVPEAKKLLAEYLPAK